MGFTKGDAMGLEGMKPRTAFLLLVGSAITILFIMSCTALWRNNYHEAVLFLVLGAGLTFVFFRKRILVLASIGCAFLLVSAGLTAIFHPRDRKSTRLNSSHLGISYAVFCLKKKNTTNIQPALIIA